MKKSLGAKTLIYPTPVWIIGTYDQHDRPNAMAVAWGGVCCSKPPSVAVSLRKATYSYAGMILRKAFTVNVAPEWLVEASDYFGTASGRNTDKFADTGLTPVKSDLVDAPYIKEFPLILECRLSHTVEIGLHTQFVGEILDVKADEEMLGENGLPDILKVKPLIYAPSGGYYVVGDAVGTAYQIGKKFAKGKLSDED